MASHNDMTTSLVTIIYGTGGDMWVLRKGKTIDEGGESKVLGNCVVPLTTQLETEYCVGYSGGSPCQKEKLLFVTFNETFSSEIKPMGFELSN